MKQPWVHVIGGGIAGLSLARELANYPKLPGNVVISDPRTHYDNDRTFGFWFTAKESHRLNPEFSVGQWSISTTTSTALQTGLHYRYGVRSAGSVYAEALSKIDAHPQIIRVTEETKTRPAAEHVYDGRPPSIEHFKVVQAFSGTEIQCATPHGVDTVGLMDALQVVPSGVQFRYVLPLDAHRLLVEHTLFTEVSGDLQDLDRLNTQWIDAHWPKATVLRHEAAQIPMGYRQSMHHLGFPIGARGEMTRPATGYGYRTMQYWAKQEADRLIKQNQARRFQPSALHQWMDHLFLDLITARPDVLPDIFLALGRRLTGDQFAQFMMRQQTFDAMRVILAAPKKPFSLALIGKPQWI